MVDPLESRSLSYEGWGTQLTVRHFSQQSRGNHSPQRHEGKLEVSCLQSSKEGASLTSNLLR